MRAGVGFYTDLDRSKIEVREIYKMRRHAVDSNMLFISDLFIPEENRIREEGQGFKMILHGLNPERILIAAEAIGLGWAQLEVANLMVMKAAALFDAKQDCGVEANAGKCLAAETAFEACHTAMLTLGGMGYAQEYHVERYLREVLIPRTAPVSPHMILNFIAEKVLGLPKSY